MKITIDAREIEAREGESVLTAAKRNGIDIPHLCAHDKLSTAGSCRMCLVKVNNLPKLQPACNMPVQDKMTVQTTVPQVAEARKQVLQFMLVNHPLDCGVCDKAGECKLQDYQHRYGGVEAPSVEPKEKRRKLHELGPRILLDNERCILCSRCVRFTREISKSDALGIVERGHHAYVECTEGKPFEDPYSDNVIDLCPVGALLHRDFLHECRVWFLEPVRSVCTGCSRGCSINAWRRKKTRAPRMPGHGPENRAYRVSAFDDATVNGPWLCNKGFDMHRAMAREGDPRPTVDGRPVALESAIPAARSRIAAARSPAIRISAHASNEELDALAAAFGSRLALYAQPDALAAPGEVVEDDVLIRADKSPNRAGVAARFGTLATDVPETHDLVLSWTERALEVGTVTIPLSTTFERDGTFTNFEGKARAFRAVFEAPSTAAHAAELFARLAL